MLTDPHSEPDGRSQRPSVINRGPDLVRSHQLFHCLIAASLIACSDCLGSFWRGAPVETVIKWPICLRGRRGGHCDSAVGEIRGVGLFNPQFKPFCAQDFCSCCMFKPATFFIQWHQSSSCRVLKLPSLISHWLEQQSYYTSPWGSALMAGHVSDDATE